MISRTKLIEVYSVDQMLDFYEMKNKPLPDAITITKRTYEALLAFVNDGKREPYKSITHYRGAELKVK